MLQCYAERRRSTESENSTHCIHSHFIPSIDKYLPLLHHRFFFYPSLLYNQSLDGCINYGLKLSAPTEK